MACNGNSGSNSCRFKLEQDIQRLQQLLNEEMMLHLVLEEAATRTPAKQSDLSCLPYDASELLSNIAILETTVSRLEEEKISLQFQLSQERNERRLAEYRLKRPPSPSLPARPPDNCSSCSSGLERLMLNVENIPEVECSEELGIESEIICSKCGPCLASKDTVYGIIQEDISREMFQHLAVGIVQKEIPVGGLSNHPNLLSEQIARCMKNIFISLADSSSVRPNYSSSEGPQSSVSPTGHLSRSSNWSLSEISTISSWVRSPQVDLQSNSEPLATGGVFDPYKVRGKLSWTNIGTYGSVVEVSLMSVGKKQLEYASGALRIFRSLIEQLADVNPIHLSDNEKLAFWINIYNALIMHAYLAYGVPKSDIKLFSLMQKAAYTVGGQSFSAACIEYFILKMKPPIHRPQIALLLAIHKLKVSEEQKRFLVRTPEPLAIFALSCGTYSSPVVRIFTPGKIREELQEAQRDYIRASVGLSNKGKLLVPKMLHCFARSFVDDANLAIWISHFLPQEQAVFVEHCISQRRQSILGSRNCGILPFDSRFRYLLLPDVSS